MELDPDEVITESTILIYPGQEMSLIIDTNKSMYSTKIDKSDSEAITEILKKYRDFEKI